MSENKIVRIRFLDHSSLDTNIVREIKECPQVVYTIYGKILFEDDKFVVITSLSDNIDEMPVAYIASRRSFTMRIIKSAITEKKELKVVE